MFTFLDLSREQHNMEIKMNKAKATYTIGSGRFAGKTVDILDQWDYAGAKYELYEFRAYSAKHSEWKKVEHALANTI